MKKLPRPGERRPDADARADAPADARADARPDARPDASADEAGGAVDASPYRASSLPPEDDSLELPPDAPAPAPARVDIAAAVAAAGLAGGDGAPAADGGGDAGSARGEGAGAGDGASGGTARAARRRPSAPNRRQRRRFARERTVQALYQWHMTGASSSDVRREFLATQEMDRVDVDYFEAAFRGVTLEPGAIDDELGAVLDRDLAEVDPIERAILRLGTWELRARPDVPALVVITEAVEIARRFCAEPGRRYVNGVLDRLATVLRGAEMGRP